METPLNLTFEQLYKSYYPRLATYASFFIEKEEVHDLVQEIFLDLLEKGYAMFDEKGINAYLYKAVRNKCIDAIRHGIVKEEYKSYMGKKLLEIESEYFSIYKNEIEEKIISQELQQQITSTIESLPPKGKEVFKLYFENQKTAKEIASILNVSSSTVENHIYTSIKTLRQKLAKYLLFLFI